MSTPFSCRHDGKRFIFRGPDFEAKAILSRGAIRPDFELGLKALREPVLMNRIRIRFDVKVPRERGRKILTVGGVTGNGYKLEFYFPGKVPVALEWALRDVLKRHQPAGTHYAETSARQREVMARNNASGKMVRIPLTGDPEEFALMRRMKAEDPAALREYLARRNEENDETSGDEPQTEE